MSEWLHDVYPQSFALSSSSSFPFSPGSDLVWQNRGDRQHTKSRLCQEVHPGLLLWGEAEPALWRVSYFVWSGPLRTHTPRCACFRCAAPFLTQSPSSSFCFPHHLNIFFHIHSASLYLFTPPISHFLSLNHFPPLFPDSLLRNYLSVQCLNSHSLKGDWYKGDKYFI